MANKEHIVTLLGAIVDPEWAAMWGEDAKPENLLDLAAELRSDAEIIGYGHEQHQLKHDAAALLLIHDLLTGETTL